MNYIGELINHFNQYTITGSRALKGIITSRRRKSGKCSEGLFQSRGLASQRQQYSIRHLYPLALA